MKVFPSMRRLEFSNTYKKYAPKLNFFNGMLKVKLHFNSALTEITNTLRQTFSSKIRVSLMKN